MYALFVVLDVVLLIAGWIVPLVLLSRADRRYHRKVDTTLDRLVRRGVVHTDDHPVLVILLILIQLGWLLPPTVLGVVSRKRYGVSRQEY